MATQAMVVDMSGLSAALQSRLSFAGQRSNALPSLWVNNLWVKTKRKSKKNLEKHGKLHKKTQ
jgi:hypothetical protein